MNTTLFYIMSYFVVRLVHSHTHTHTLSLRRMNDDGGEKRKLLLPTNNLKRTDYKIRNDSNQQWFCLYIIILFPTLMLCVCDALEFSKDFPFEKTNVDILSESM